MHNRLKVFSLVVLSLTVFSCAKETSEDSYVVENKIVDSYYQEKVSDKDNWEHTASGLYVKTEKEGTGATPTYSDWVQINYQGETLNGNIFQTTDTTTFQYLGYNLFNYHIVPDFLYMSGNMPQAFREMLLKMKEGGKVDMIIPSYMGFGSYGAVAFGQMPLLPNYYVPANTPIRYSMELVKVISDPTLNDSLTVKSYVDANPGFVKLGDNNNIYIKIIKKGSSEPSDTIGNGSTVGVRFAGFFLDKLREGNVPEEYKKYNIPYCFDTNIDSIAAKYHPYMPNYSSSTTDYKEDVFSITLSATSNTAVTGFEMAIRELTNGGEAEVVFTSTYGYGVSGNSASTYKPAIGPYTPLRFFIKVVSVTKK